MIRLGLSVFIFCSAVHAQTAKPPAPGNPRDEYIKSEKACEDLATYTCENVIDHSDYEDGTGGGSKPFQPDFKIETKAREVAKQKFWDAFRRPENKDLYNLVVDRVKFDGVEKCRKEPRPPDDFCATQVGQALSEVSRTMFLGRAGMPMAEYQSSIRLFYQRSLEALHRFPKYLEIASQYNIDVTEML